MKSIAFKSKPNPHYIDYPLVLYSEDSEVAKKSLQILHIICIFSNYGPCKPMDLHDGQKFQFHKIRNCVFSNRMSLCNFEHIRTPQQVGLHAGIYHANLALFSSLANTIKVVHCEHKFGRECGKRKRNSLLFSFFFFILSQQIDRNVCCSCPFFAILCPTLQLRVSFVILTLLRLKQGLRKYENLCKCKPLRFWKAMKEEVL